MTEKRRRRSAKTEEIEKKKKKPSPKEKINTRYPVNAIDQCGVIAAMAGTNQSTVNRAIYEIGLRAALQVAKTGDPDKLLDFLHKADADLHSRELQEV